MAPKKQAGTGRGQGRNQRRALSDPPQTASNKRHGAQRSTMADSAIFDERTRRDMTSIAFFVIAAIIFIAAVLPTEALITHAFSTALHSLLGIGSYLLPFVLAGVGATFLVKHEDELISGRIALGLGLIFVAILSIAALFSPLGPTGNPQLLFVEDNLVSHGGYVGALFAWLGLMLFGQVVSCVFFIGVACAGLAIVGFSLSKLIERIAALRADAANRPPRESVFNRLLSRGADRRAYAAPYAMEAPQTGRVVRAERQPNFPVSASATRAIGGGVGSADRRSRLRGRSGAFDESSVSPDAAFPPFDTDDSLPFDDGEAAASAATAKTRAIGSSRRRGARMANELAGNQTRRIGKSEGGAEDEGKTPATTRTLAQPPSGDAKAEDEAEKGSPSSAYHLPPFSLLKKSGKGARSSSGEAEARETAACLQSTLEDFGVMAQVVGWVAGPTVTLYKVDLPAGLRVSRVMALNDDIALALAAPGVRIFAPIPGTNYVGIEVPNQKRQVVLLSDVLVDAGEGPLQIAIGKNVEGQSITSDLAKMPHLLIGGTTGSGKSVSINGMIMSILMRATPDEVRFIMIDPKRVEFTPYNGIPHLYVPVVTECKEAASALSWGVAEMERRLKVFSKVGARNIMQYNDKVRAGEIEDEEKPLPYIVIVIDELADLMMNVGKEVEFSISRIAQLARAAGIHLIVATQRPSANVVTGLIKANITNRIAFNVASGIDSRVVLDTPGAENLIGLGDLLFSKPEYPKPQRIQGCYVSEDEINAVVENLKSQGEPEYHDEILQTNLITLGASSPSGAGSASDSDDPLLWEAAEIVVSSGLGSTSNIQRRLKLGYSRAGRIMDQLEEKGVVGPPNGSKPREVLVDTMELETLKAFENNDED